MIRIQGNAFGKVRGDDRMVIVMGVGLQRAICLHADGTFSTPKLEDVTLNVMETGIRFYDLEEQNKEMFERIAREQGLL